MGEGGVACMPLQHLMEKYPVSEVYCGGGSNVNGNGNGKNNAKMGKKSSVKVSKKRMKLKREPFLKKDDPKKSELGPEGQGTSTEAENGEVKEEVEEGELGTLKSPIREVDYGEFTPEKSEAGEIEKGEIVLDRWREGETEKGEILPRKGRKGEPEKSIFNSGRLQGNVAARRDLTPEKYKKFDVEKSDFGTWRGGRDEIEKGEFIPDRWQKKDFLQEEYSHTKSRKHDFSMDRDWRDEHEWTPPSGKYLVEEFLPGKDFNKIGTQHSRRPARWDAAQDRSYSKLSSKIVDEGSSRKNEQIRAKNHGREHSSSSSSRLKRHGNDLDSIDRKHFEDHVDYSTYKSRRLSGDSGRSVHMEHFPRHSVERLYKDTSSSRIGSERYSARRHGFSSSSSRSGHDRYGHSPSRSQRSPHERTRHHNHRHQTPIRHDCSSYDRRCHPDNKNRSPGNAERSPQDRPHVSKDQSPSSLEQSPYDRSKAQNRKASEKREVTETTVNCNVEEENTGCKDPVKSNIPLPTKVSHGESFMQNESVEHSSIICQIVKEDLSQISGGPSEEIYPQENGLTEELPSMEEDMDICDTPPHVSHVADTNIKKWCYLDHLGFERGPSRLYELKALVEGGVLMSDHLIKHLDYDRWVTLENAVSPIVTLSYPSISPDVISQLPVNLAEDPSILLPEIGDVEECLGQSCEESEAAQIQPDSCTAYSLEISDTGRDLKIDARVGALLGDNTLVPGKELEAVGEVLHMNLNDLEWERWASLEGLTGHDSHTVMRSEHSVEDLSNSASSKDAVDSSSNATFDSDFGYSFFDFNEWFSIHWPCKGGDWRRIDESVQERSFQKKLVLNDGYPVCQMPKSGCEDPRRHDGEDLYYPFQSRRLDLPPWAFSLTDERNEVNVVGRPGQPKPLPMRGVKGTMLPVVRINACVVKDQGSFVSDPRSRVRSKDKQSSKSSRPNSSHDVRRSSAEGTSLSKEICGQDMEGSVTSSKSIVVSKDHLCTSEELRLDFGDWYYLDGAGHEHGPFLYSELHLLVDKGLVSKNSSVYRKTDQIWVPIMPSMEIALNDVPASDLSGSSLQKAIGTGVDEGCSVSSAFHSLHPQFIGYTRGKLHELVMKAFKNREFSAAINEVLDPWISAKQPKKEMEKNARPEGESYFLHEDHIHGGKRARLTVDLSNEDCVMEDNSSSIQDDESAFEDLCGDATFPQKVSDYSECGGWGKLDGNILARIFHFLRADMKSLVVAASTCQQWRDAAYFYQDVSRIVDLSSVGIDCTDRLIRSIMSGYSKGKVKFMILAGCIHITSAVLEEILQSFSCISSIDIRGCSQLIDLVEKYPDINWVKDSPGSTKRMKFTFEKATSIFSLRSDIDDSTGLKDYFDMVEKRDAANQAFRQSLYKRTKVFDTRRSASILSRDAQMRRWTMKRPGGGFKRMEEYVLLSLNSIMKENVCEFFVPKVSVIEDRIKRGYYAVRGLSSMKEDICRMCREAVKRKSRGDGGDMNKVMTEFIKLATRVGGSKRSDVYELMKVSKEDYSSSSNLKKHNKMISERKVYKSNGSSFSKCGSDHGEYSSDREVKRYLSKLNKKSLDSEESSSDEYESSSDGESSGGSTSNTESDMDVWSDSNARDAKDGYLMEDQDFDLSTEREWGARMTKASLVPPVTRKYDVIDEYLILADEEEVRRKMRVSLPDDYDEKVKAQKVGMEETDMEIPEVKEFKPRKQLGHEVIEQEVYGIDPYTHNLLLDSMSKVEDWSPQQKHDFIEDILLRTLNKQVREFTGSGNTPMTYCLRPVIQDVLNTAEAQQDMRTQKLCQALLEAVDDRPGDKYVAYRKGLGVVCNREGGIEKDDFVVEFLGEVYPTWKWFEKQDGIRSLQKNNKDPAPEFYNIYLERPKGDADGYDLVVVDAMHKANYASRICHSCLPNCEAKVTAVGGHYQIGIYSVRPILFGEEITFDYNSVTESKEEYEASVCLCGSQVCRGSYLNLTGEGAFQKVMKEWHGLLDRHQLMLEACELNWVSEEDYIDLGKAGLGSCLLGGLPDWLIAYTARLVRFINFERTKLPQEILKHNLEEKGKYFADISLEDEKSDAEIQAEGVFNQRLQNLALTLDKVRYVMRRVFGDPKNAPPPLQKLNSEEIVSCLWKGNGSLVDELLRYISPHVENGLLNDLKSKIRARDPSVSDDIEKELRRSMLWLRDEVRNLPCTVKSRHDAAADLIHIYAYTKCFFKIKEYKVVKSPPVYISPLDLGPKSADKLTGLTQYCKTYSENYCLGQLIYWHNQSNADPDRALAKASRGCLALPDVGSFYARAQKQSRQLVYGPRTVRFMLNRMEKQPQRTWPKDRIWEFRDFLKVVGSPMLDAVLNKCPLDREMVNWLKNRPAVFHALWDR
ncbi:hypothetical protein V2J09_010818 [Rumex salicifolius]